MTLLAIAPGPTEILRSSAPLAWRGFLLEKHRSLPGNRTASSIDRDVVSMLCGRSACLEYGNAIRKEAAGTITIIPNGPVPDVRLHTAAESLHCAFDAEFTRRVIAEMDRLPAKVTFRSGLRDCSMQRLLNLLVEEMEAGAPSGRLYVESLAHALTSRYLLLDCLESSTSALPRRILNRVREKIEVDFRMDISLEDLAKESGYSRAHFLRMFRVATGITPHQYVLDVRLRHAQESLKRKGANLIDIAAMCGFCSQSHMTTVFRKRLGVTPAEFRRSQ